MQSLKNADQMIEITASLLEQIQDMHGQISPDHTSTSNNSLKNKIGLMGQALQIIDHYPKSRVKRYYIL